MTITAHCLVKNEENYVWYAINSVIDQVDKMLVWDTGSSDRTVEIVKSIKNSKILFSQKGERNAKGIAGLRQEMLEETKNDWVFILDGDEIWGEPEIESTLDLARNADSGRDVIVSPNLMMIGDIFHYQEAAAGRYKIGGRRGHLNIRAIKKSIPGLHIEGEYPNEAYVDKDGKAVQDFSEDRLIFSNHPYLHTSFLDRSPVKLGTKYELGIPTNLDFYYPEVFFTPRPQIVPSPWRRRTGFYELVSFFQTPLKKMRRRMR